MKKTFRSIVLSLMLLSFSFVSSHAESSESVFQYLTDTGVFSMYSVDDLLRARLLIDRELSSRDDVYILRQGEHVVGEKNSIPAGTYDLKIFDDDSSSVILYDENGQGIDGGSLVYNPFIGGASDFHGNRVTMTVENGQTISIHSTPVIFCLKE